MPLFPGARLGSLRLVARLRVSESGETWRARDPQGRTVAVQTLEFSTGSGLLPAVGLDHPNLRSIHDLGSAEGRPYLVLETLSGETLAERLARASLPLEEVLDVASGIAAGLEALHRAGLVHGNLDPEKVFLAGGATKLVDFGLGRKLRSFVSAAPRDAVPAAGDLAPGFGFVSPEEDRGEPVGPRSDVYSFGAILDEMISGPPPTSAEAAAVLAALRELVGRCLAVDPAARCADGSELVAALGLVAAEKQRVESASRARGSSRRRRIAAGWTIVAGIAFAAFVQEFWARAKPESPRPAPTAGVVPPPRVASSDMGEEPPASLDRASEGQPAASRGETE